MRYCWLLLSICLGLSAQSSWMPYTPRVDGGGYSADRTFGFAEGLLPVIGNDSYLAYVDARGYLFSKGAYEADIGVGFRYLSPGCCWIAGVYAFYDHWRMSNLRPPGEAGRVLVGSEFVDLHEGFSPIKRFRASSFSRLTVGFELIGNGWDGRINLYQPLGSRTKISGEYFQGTVISGNTLRVDHITRFERQQTAFDWEIGGFFPTHCKLRGYIGSYHFVGSKDYSWSNGVQARAEYHITNWMVLHIQNRYDGVRKNQFLAGIRLHFGGAPRKPVRCPLACRMTDRPVRDLGTLFNGGARTLLVEEKGAPFICPYIFVINTNPNTGNGSLKNPWQTLELAQNNTVAGDMIFVFTGTGSYTIPATLQLKDDQVWQGNGVALPECGIAAAARPNFNLEVQVADGNELLGFNIDGQNNFLEGMTGSPTTLTMRDIAIRNFQGDPLSGDSVRGINLTTGAVTFGSNVLVEKITAGSGRGGANGPNPGDSGVVGDPGGSAIGVLIGAGGSASGTITIQDITSGAGGKGGNGAAGPSDLNSTPGGAGGVGGTSGEAIGIRVPTFDFAVNPTISRVTAEAGGLGGNGALGGTGPAGGDGGNGGNAGQGGTGGVAYGIETATLSSLTNPMVSDITSGTGGSAGSAGNGQVGPGNGGTGGNGGTLGAGGVGGDARGILSTTSHTQVGGTVTRITGGAAGLPENTINGTGGDGGESSGTGGNGGVPSSGRLGGQAVGIEVDTAASITGGFVVSNIANGANGRGSNGGNGGQGAVPAGDGGNGILGGDSALIAAEFRAIGILGGSGAGVTLMNGTIGPVTGSGGALGGSGGQLGPAGGGGGSTGLPGGGGDGGDGTSANGYRFALAPTASGLTFTGVTAGARGEGGVPGLGGVPGAPGTPGTAANTNP